MLLVTDSDIGSSPSVLYVQLLDGKTANSMYKFGTFLLRTIRCSGADALEISMTGSCICANHMEASLHTMCSRLFLGFVRGIVNEA